MKKLLSILISILIFCSAVLGATVYAESTQGEKKELTVTCMEGHERYTIKVGYGEHFNKVFTPAKDMTIVGPAAVMGNDKYIWNNSKIKGSYEVDIPCVTDNVFIGLHYNSTVPEHIVQGDYGYVGLTHNNMANVSFYQRLSNGTDYPITCPVYRQVIRPDKEIVIKPDEGYEIVSLNAYKDKDAVKVEVKKLPDGSYILDGDYMFNMHLEGVVVSVESEIKAKEITLSANKAAIDVGKTKTLKATISPSDATIKDVKWQSNNTKVATVDENGKVTAVKKGTATITATALDGSGVKAKCSITVKQPVKSIKLNVKTKTIKVGQKLKIKATVKPDNANDKYVKWIANNNKIKLSAIKTKSGKYNTVTAKKVGKTNITVKPNDGSKISVSCKITVKKK
ncbi:MAG: Ig domain-containing protein [Oscillospiraceae bacterium]|nr:Ig domain-containing protein [Oscillospiraceae bacterium]